MGLAIWTLLSGATLLALAGGGFVAADQDTLLGLIPGVVGFVLLLLGIVAVYDGWRGETLAAGFVISLVGVVSALRGVPDLLAWADGGVWSGVTLFVKVGLALTALTMTALFADALARTRPHRGPQRVLA